MLSVSETAPSRFITGTSVGVAPFETASSYLALRSLFVSKAKLFFNKSVVSVGYFSGLATSASLLCKYITYVSEDSSIKSSKV